MSPVRNRAQLARLDRLIERCSAGACDGACLGNRESQRCVHSNLASMSGMVPATLLALWRALTKGVPASQGVPHVLFSETPNADRGDDCSPSSSGIPQVFGEFMISLGLVPDIQGSSDFWGFELCRPASRSFSKSPLATSFLHHSSHCLNSSSVSKRAALLRGMPAIVANLLIESLSPGFSTCAAISAKFWVLSLERYFV